MTDLVSASIRSGRLLDLNALRLSGIDDSSLLISLAGALDAAVSAGLDLAHRLDPGNRRPLRVGLLHRVYYVSAAELAGQDDPDRFVTGIAPSVKLLHAVVERLSKIDLDSALQFVRRWELRTNVPIYRRLWAAMARDTQIATADEVATFLRSIDVDTFWDLYGHSEIAELRARRFAGLSARDQAAILARIRKLPPKRKWQRGTAQEIESYRTRAAAQELRRIELTGVVLPDSDRAWLDAQRPKFSALAEFNQIEAGFPRTFVGRWVGGGPDSRFDTVEGENRLKTLQTALTSSDGPWDDDPAERARAWIRQHSRQVLTVLAVTQIRLILGMRARK